MGFVREQVKLGQQVRFERLLWVQRRRTERALTGNVLLTQSVVQVEDAQTYLRNVKKHLSDKQGVPSEHHRLTFAVAPAVGTESGSKYLPGSAESLLAGLSTWQVNATVFILLLLTVSMAFIKGSCVMLLQALVHQNRKCVGQFFNPRLYSVSQVTDTAFDSQTDKTPVQQLCIIYDSFRAASGTGAQSLLVPLVPACKSEQYRFTVFGRCDNRNFVLPVTYQFSGQQAAYSLQKALYIDKHRHSSAQTSAGVECLSSLTTAKDLTINFGMP